MGNNLQVTGGQTRVFYLETPLPTQKSSSGCISSLVNCITGIFRKIFYCFFSSKPRSAHDSKNTPLKTQILQPPARTPTPSLKQTNLQNVANTVTTVVPKVPQPISTAAARPLPSSVTMEKIQSVESPLAPMITPPAVAKVNTRLSDDEVYQKLTLLSTKCGLTVLHFLPFLTCQQDPKQEQAKRLIDRAIAEGIDINNQTHASKVSPLHASMRTIYNVLGISQYEKILDALMTREYRTFVKISANSEISLYLINKGANINAKNDQGETPLALANGLEAATQLLDAGATIDCAVLVARITLVINHINHPDNAQILQLLTERGADFEVIDAKTKNALLQKTFENAVQNVSPNDAFIALIDKLLALGAELDPPSTARELLKSALSKAIDKAVFYPEETEALLAIATKLIKIGATLKTADPDGDFLNCALKQTIHNTANNPDWAKALLGVATKLMTLGATLETTDPKGKLLESALKEAIHSPEKAKDLLNLAENSLDLSNTRLKIADPNGELLRGALSKAIDKVIFYPEETEGFLAIATKLIERGAMLKIADPQGDLLRSALNQARYATANCPDRTKSALDIAKLLIRCGASKETEFNGKTLSDAAVENNWEDFTQFLNTLNIH